MSEYTVKHWSSHWHSFFNSAYLENTTVCDFQLLHSFLQSHNVNNKPELHHNTAWWAVATRVIEVKFGSKLGAKVIHQNYRKTKAVSEVCEFATLNETAMRHETSGFLHEFWCVKLPGAKLTFNTEFPSSFPLNVPALSFPSHRSCSLNKIRQFNKLPSNFGSSLHTEEN